MMDFFKKLIMCNNDKSFITNSSNPIDTSKVNRIELISQNGRDLSSYTTVGARNEL